MIGPSTRVDLKTQLANERSPGSAGQYGVGNDECLGQIITATGSVSFQSGANVTIYGIVNAGANAVADLVLAGIKNEVNAAKNITIPLGSLTAGAVIRWPGLIFPSGLTLTVGGSDADKFMILYRLTGS